MVRGNFERRIEIAATRKQTVDRSKQHKRDERTLGAKLRSVVDSDSVNVWFLDAGEGHEVCTKSFYSRTTCTNRKCKLNHSIFPLIEKAPDACKRITSTKGGEGGGKKGKVALVVAGHIELKKRSDRAEYKFPPLSDIIYVTFGDRLFYSSDEGFIKPLNAVKPPPPPPTENDASSKGIEKMRMNSPKIGSTKVALPKAVSEGNLSSKKAAPRPNPFPLLPDAIMINICGYVHFRHFGLVALTSKEMYERCYNPKMVEILDKAMGFNVITKDPALNTDIKRLRMLRELLLDMRNVAVLQELPIESISAKSLETDSGPVMLNSTHFIVSRNRMDKNILVVKTGPGKGSPAVIQAAPLKKGYVIESYGATSSYLITLSGKSHNDANIAKFASPSRPVMTLLKTEDVLCEDGIQTSTPSIDLSEFLSEQFKAHPELILPSGGNSWHLDTPHFEACLVEQSQVTAWPAAGRDSFVITLPVLWVEDAEDVEAVKSLDCILLNYSDDGGLQIIKVLARFHLYDKVVGSYHIEGRDSSQRGFERDDCQQMIKWFCDGQPRWITDCNIKDFDKRSKRLDRLVTQTVGDTFAVRNPQSEVGTGREQLDSGLFDAIEVAVRVKGGIFETVRDLKILSGELGQRYVYFANNRRMKIVPSEYKYRYNPIEDAYEPVSANLDSGFGGLMHHLIDIEYKIAASDWVSISGRHSKGPKNWEPHLGDRVSCVNSLDSASHATLADLQSLTPGRISRINHDGTFKIEGPTVIDVSKELLIPATGNGVQNLNVEVNDGRWLVVYNANSTTKATVIQGIKKSFSGGEEFEREDIEDFSDLYSQLNRKKTKKKKKKKRLASMGSGRKKDNFARGQSHGG